MLQKLAVEARAFVGGDLSCAGRPTEVHTREGKLVKETGHTCLLVCTTLPNGGKDGDVG